MSLATTLLAFITIIAGLTSLHALRERAYVNESLLWTRRVHGLDEISARLLEPFLGYPFLAPEEHLRGGISYMGAARRLRSFVSRLRLNNGSTPLKVGVVGGSVSFGERASVPEAAWFNIFTSWLDSVSKTGVIGRNGCIPGTPSSYMAMCLELSVDQDTDILFVEYLVNDGLMDYVINNTVVRNIERLVRKALSLPHGPAVVLMQTARVMGGDDESTRWPYPYTDTSEDLEGAVSRYYDVQAVATRNVLWPLAADMPDIYWWNQTYYDRHPGDIGHKIMADVAVYLIQEAAISLLINPVTERERTLLQAPLPPATMFVGNMPPASVACAAGETFRRLVTSANGWKWVNEGTEEKKKEGFVSTKPGKFLNIQVDSVRPHLDPKAIIPVMVSYLGSYAHMGVASISCVRGCTCDAVHVNAHIEELVSQNYMAPVMVTQSPACVLRVEVLHTTFSGEHKFKVVGVVISDSTYVDRAFNGLLPGSERGSDGMHSHWH